MNSKNIPLLSLLARSSLLQISWTLMGPSGEHYFGYIVVLHLSPTMPVMHVLSLVTKPGEEQVSGFRANNSPTTAEQDQPAMAFALLLCPDTASANHSLLRNYSVLLLCSPRGFDQDDVYVEHPILQTVPLPYCCTTETRHFIIRPLQMEVNFGAETASLFAVVCHPRR